MKILNLKESNAKSDFIKKSRENATYKKMEKLASSHGYKLGLAYWASWDGTVIHLNPESGSYFSEYLPEIYPPDYTSSNGTDWRIQTTSYGSLDSVEFEKFIQANDDAYKLVEELSKIDLRTLEHEPKEAK